MLKVWARSVWSYQLPFNWRAFPRTFNHCKDTVIPQITEAIPKLTLSAKSCNWDFINPCCDFRSTLYLNLGKQHLIAGLPFSHSEWLPHPTMLNKCHKGVSYRNLMHSLFVDLIIQPLRVKNSEIEVDQGWGNPPCRKPPP